MKINKIICDACNIELDVEKDSGLAAFEYIEVKPKISFDRSPADPNAQMKTDKEIVKHSYDLCKKCADTVVDHIEKQKAAAKKLEDKTPDTNKVE